MNFVRIISPKNSMVGLIVLFVLISTRVGAVSMGEAKSVEVDGLTTSYFEGGKGEAMVLVHGGGFGSTVSANCWQPIFDHLSSHFHVYAIDKLGQGYTDNPQSDADYTMEAVTLHIHRFMETLGIHKVHLVGHSRGALPTIRIAMDHPELVDNLILFNSRTLSPDVPVMSSLSIQAPAQVLPPTSSAIPTRENIRDSLLSNPDVYHKDYVTDEYVEAELQVALLPKLNEAVTRMDKITSDWAERHPEEIQKNPRIRSRWWYNQLKIETFDRINAGWLEAPTLMIWGFNDSSARPALGMSLYRIIALASGRVEFHFLNQSGHYVFQEYPREVTQLMVDFVSNSKE